MATLTKKDIGKETLLHPEFYNLVRTNKRATRSCLSCGKKFKSRSISHRTCWYCKNEQEGYSKRTECAILF